MGEHSFDLFFIQSVKQGVKEYNSLVFANAGEIRISVSAPFGAIHDKQPIKGKLTALCQRLDALLEGSLLQGLKTIEQGGNDVGKQPHDKQAKAHPDEPCPKGPKSRGMIHHPKYCSKEGPPQCQ